MNGISFDDRSYGIIMWIQSLALEKGKQAAVIQVTRGMVARRYNITRTQSARVLERMVQEGQLVSEKWHHGKLGMYAYALTQQVLDILDEQQELPFEYNEDNG